MHSIAIDDEHIALDVIQLHAAKIPFLELKAGFRDALKALDYLQKNKTDLIFLDINMPDISGIDFIKSLANKPLLIFTTAYSSYALESYDFNAVDYLLKPIEFNRFLIAANKAYELFYLKSKTLTPQLNPEIITENQNYIFIKSGSQVYKIAGGDILFAQSEGNYITFYTKENKKILSRLTMQEALKILPKEQFMRVHKSYIVAFRYIDLIEKQQLKIGQIFIPISHTYKEEIWKRFEKNLPD